MDLTSFVAELAKQQLGPVELAVAMLWFRQHHDLDYLAKASDLVRMLKEHGLVHGQMNTTRFRSQLKDSPVLFEKRGSSTRYKLFSIRPEHKNQLDQRYGSLVGQGAGRTTEPTIRELKALVTKLPDRADRSFLEETLICITHDAPRAAIALGWCAVIDRIQRRIEALGWGRFNEAVNRIKARSSGKTKVREVHSHNDLLLVFDNELLLVTQEMGLLDKNQHDRLKDMLSMRNRSAHPASTPVRNSHVSAFISDAIELVLANVDFHV